MKRIIVLCVLFLITPLSWVAGAENDQKNSSVPMLLQENTIKNMIGIVSRQVARRYDLRPEQSTVAQEMMEKNTLSFVNKHYDAFVELVPEFQSMRMRVMGGDDPSPQEVQALAKKMLPIYQEATELIVRENEKFATVLDDQQKKKHQKDMDRMKKDVAQTMEKLNRWEKGQYEPGEFLNRRPRRESPNKPRQKDQEKMSPTSFDFWELYVKTFIDAFQLDQGQITLAYSVLNDLKTQAQAYRKDHESEIREIDRQIQELSRPTTQPDPKQNEELKSWQKKLAKANQPLFDMFETLKVKLMDIPTDAQRKAAQTILGGEEPAKTDSAAEGKK
jgi:hypothetical protein